jgi:hypothetical protein
LTRTPLMPIELSGPWWRRHRFWLTTPAPFVGTRPTVVAGARVETGTVGIATGDAPPWPPRRCRQHRAGLLHVIELGAPNPCGTGEAAPTLPPAIHATLVEAVPRDRKWRSPCFHAASPPGLTPGERHHPLARPTPVAARGPADRPAVHEQQTLGGRPAAEDGRLPVHAVRRPRPEQRQHDVRMAPLHQLQNLAEAVAVLAAKLGRSYQHVLGRGEPGGRYSGGAADHGAWLAGPVACQGLSVIGWCSRTSLGECRPYG